MYYVYILQSQFDNSFYIGYSQDVNKRLLQHNNGESKYTAGKRPWQLVYFETYHSKTDALKREKFLKRQRNKSFYESLISNFTG